MNLEKRTQSLSEVIKRKIKRKASFLELGPNTQRYILDYIKNNGIDLKVFGNKWYDILSNKFFVVEYKPMEGTMIGIDKEEKVFDTFEEFFNYVRGDIYEHSCFNGYKFSEQEIEKFSIDIKSLNFDSFTSETIDLYSFESITAFDKEKSIANADRVKDLLKWFRDCKPISSLSDLETNYSQFTQKFDFLDSGNVFLSMILRRDNNIIKEAAIEFACKHDIDYGSFFDTILLTYGREAALYVIDNFVGECSNFIRKIRIRNFKDTLHSYDSGSLILYRRLGFDSSLQLYYVKDMHSNKQERALNYHNFFGSFNDFVSFVDGDLSGADLSRAPITKKDILKYKINTITKLPLSEKYESYEVKKKYNVYGFTIKQRWFNGDITIFEKEHVFERFFDFVHFLNGDLSGSDLLLCDGIENISALSGLKLDEIKVRSEIAEKLGLPLNLLPENKLDTKSFEFSDKNELETVENLLVDHPEDDDFTGRVSYISDIHLLHRFKAYKCRTPEDVKYVLRTIAKTIGEEATGVNLIGGDTSGNFEIFKDFVSNLAAYRRRGDFFFALGNHELWDLDGESLEMKVGKYREVLEDKGQGKMHLVQNNLFYMNDEWKEISEQELSSISLDELRAKTRSARLIIFGGIGFAGMNDEFNANNGIYMDVLDREGEVKESTKFLALYEKVTTILKDKNLIVLSHMQMRDWGGGDMYAKNGVVYVNGHSHSNYFYDDGKKRICADNQIGYRGRRISLKQVAIDFNYDWFADYKDGIYEITKEDYMNFYRGLGEGLTFNRQHEKLYMIKREETYMFLMRTLKDSMFILNGGSIKKAGNHSLEYFFENLVKYSKSVSLFLSKYDKFQKQVSVEVKKIGGDGMIHGSIVDIDYNNHLYLNPLDGSITPYFAYSMVDKYVYDNVLSLLKYECSMLFKNYQRLIAQQSSENQLVIYNASLPISKKKTYVASTEMYKISRILKGFQFTTKYNIVRLWNDAIIVEPSEENGRLIVSGIIDPNSLPQHVVEPRLRVTREPKTRVVQERRPKVDKIVLSDEEKIQIRNDKYKEKINTETNGAIICLNYRGPTEKAYYKCNVCGYEWSTRPDHFKDRQKYLCPKCK